MSGRRDDWEIREDFEKFRRQVAEAHRRDETLLVPDWVQAHMGHEKRMQALALWAQGVPIHLALNQVLLREEPS